MSKPVAGQWYENLGTRQHCIAVNDISCVMQWKDGGFEIVYAEDYDDLTHLPDCTGWNWVPKPRRTVTVPKWLVTDSRGKRVVLIQDESPRAYATANTVEPAEFMEVEVG